MTTAQSTDLADRIVATLAPLGRHGLTLAELVDQLNPPPGSQRRMPVPKVHIRRALADLEASGRVDSARLANHRGTPLAWHLTEADR